MKRLQQIFPLLLPAVFGFLLVGTSSCGTAGQVAAAQEKQRANEMQVNSTENGFQDLTIYLKQIAGVNIKGTGEDANISIRGVSTIMAETEPLFVIDGNAIGTSYQQIYGMINVDQVKSVRVLKSSVDTSQYGMRGANGVIEIDTKH